MIASTTCDFATARQDLSLLVGELRAAGAEIGQRTDRFCCPYHEDRTPSAGIILGDDGGHRFRCMSAACGVKGDAVDLVKRRLGCDDLAALEHLGVSGLRTAPLSNGRAPVKSNTPKPDLGQIAQDYERLIASPVDLDLLWATRAISRDAVQRFKLGLRVERYCRRWSMPIQDANGECYAEKLHLIDGYSTKKCRWEPAGVSSKQLLASLDNGGLVFLCPGELKFFAVSDCGVDAVGITTGESIPLPDRAIQLLADRDVLVVPDDDPDGAKWADVVRKQLTDASINVRVGDLGFDTSSGVNDIGDWLVRERVENARSDEAIAESLKHAWNNAHEWKGCTLAAIISSPKTWQPVTHLSTGLQSVDIASGGGLRTQGVHFIVGRPGQGKSQTVAQVVSNVSRSGAPSAFLSMELGKTDIAKLMLCQGSGIPRKVCDGGELTESYAKHVVDFDSSLPLHILDDNDWDGCLDRSQLSDIVARGVKDFGWKCVALDYMGLLAPDERDRSDFETDIRNSSELIRISKRHDIALIIVSALRKSASLSKKVDSDSIELSDVIGAGRLAYDATSVWFVRANHAGNASTIDLKCLKSRFSGSVGQTIPLRWNPETGAVMDTSI
jgi:KaiC/GvpD/RAD55 family RecA-like ATPase